MKDAKCPGGRPAKISVAEKNALVNEFFIIQANGDIKIMAQRNIYTLLAEFAQHKQIDLKPYDFSRYDEVKAQIKSLTDVQIVSTTEACAFNTLDIDAFLNSNSSLKDKRQKLVEREDYFKTLYLKSAKALETYKHQQETIESLESQLHDCKNELLSCSSVLREKRKLQAENAYLRKMIREHITDEVALAIISNAQPNIQNMTTLIASSGSEPAAQNLPLVIEACNKPTLCDIRDIFEGCNDYE